MHGEKEEKYSIHSLISKSSNELLEEYNIDNYVLGLHNTHAFRLVAIHLLEDVSTEKAILIHGTDGLGKSHLLQAAIKEIRREWSNKSVCYLNKETLYTVLRYVNHVNRRDQADSVDVYQWLFHTYDTFVLEDVDYIINNHIGLQHILYELLAYLQAHNEKVFITASVCLIETRRLTDYDLKMYFKNWTIEVQINDLEYQDKMAYLELLDSNASNTDYKFTTEVLSYIALYHGKDYGSLRKAYYKILTAYRLWHLNEEIELEAAIEILEGLLN